MSSNSLVPMLIAGVLAVIVGLIMLRLGWRGRREGDHPHCRTCGFDLFGKPEGTTQCGECGASLDEPNAVVIGVRRRRPRLILGAVGCLLLAALFIVPPAATKTSAIEWLRYYPDSWLTAGLDEPPGPRRQELLGEMVRRVTDGELDDARLKSLTDRLLTVHGDPSRAWDNSCDTLLLRAYAERPFDRPHLQRLLKQAIQVYLNTRPKIRQNTIVMRVDNGVRFSRMPFKLGGSYKSDSMTIDGINTRAGGPSMHNADGSGKPFEPLPTSSGSTAFQLDAPGLEKLTLGPKTLAVTTHFNVYLLDPPSESFEFDVTGSTPIEFVPSDASIDTFVIDPRRKEGVEASVAEVKVARKGDDVIVMTRVTPPPIALAFDVFVRPGGVDAAPWVNLGSISSASGERESWHLVEQQLPPEAAATLLAGGTCDVLLKPSPESAERFTPQLPEFWGGEITRAAVPVQSYALNFDFTDDESLRPHVLKAFSIRSVGLSTESDVLSVDFHSTGLPVPLCYKVIARVGGKELEHRSQINFVAALTKGGHSSSYSIGLRIKDAPKPLPATCDIILRPRPFYSSQSVAQGLPWAGEIVFEGVELPKPGEIRRFPRK